MEKITEIDKEKLWDRFCNYSLALDGEQSSDYYGGATVMLEWLIGEFRLQERLGRPKGEKIKK